MEEAVNAPRLAAETLDQITGRLLTTATTMYREMGMTYWLEKAETEMREIR